MDQMENGGAQQVPSRDGKSLDVRTSPLYQAVQKTNDSYEAVRGLIPGRWWLVQSSVHVG